MARNMKSVWQACMDDFGIPRGLADGVINEPQLVSLIYEKSLPGNVFSACIAMLAQINFRPAGQLTSRKSSLN